MTGCCPYKKGSLKESECHHDGYCSECPHNTKDDTISRKDAIDAFYLQADDDGWWSGTVEDIETLLKGLSSAQPEQIQNNSVHLCDSCQYTYSTCPSHGNDAVFGDGKGNNNICACNKYRPISAQPEVIRCSECKHYTALTGICEVRGKGLRLIRRPDDFCSRGARREDG